MDTKKSLKNHPGIMEHAEVDRLCAPLKEKLGITMFGYGKYYNDGTEIILTNHPKFIEYYHQGGYLLLPKALSILGSLEYSCIVANSDNITELGYNIHCICNIDHGIGLSYMGDNYFELFAFNAPLSVSMNFLLSNLDLLKRFSLYFKDVAASMIEKCNDNKIVHTYNLFNQEPVIQEIDYKKEFFEATRLPRKKSRRITEDLLLTQREIDCIRHVLLGHSFRETAEQLFLSKRTVEGYFENVKNKLGCKKKSEVIEKIIKSEAIRSAYIGTFDPVSLQTANKLSLNRNNDPAFRRLASLEKLPPRKVMKTNKLMEEALEFFYEKLKGKVGQELAQFLAVMEKGLFFTKITVNDELNAYKVFETLNSRGVQLSTHDLLKNYLFSVIHKHSEHFDSEIDSLDEKWNDIVEQLGKEDFSHFLRTVWNSEYETSTKTELFKKISGKVDSREKAYGYLESLYKQAPVYAALLSPADDFLAFGKR